MSGTEGKTTNGNAEMAVQCSHLSLSLSLSPLCLSVCFSLSVCVSLSLSVSFPSFSETLSPSLLSLSLLPFSLLSLVENLVTMSAYPPHHMLVILSVSYKFTCLTPPHTHTRFPLPSTPAPQKEKRSVIVYWIVFWYTFIYKSV